MSVATDGEDLGYKVIFVRSVELGVGR